MIKNAPPPTRMIHADDSTTILYIDCEHQFKEHLPSDHTKAVCRTCHQRLFRYGDGWRHERERKVMPSLYNPYAPPRKDEDE